MEDSEQSQEATCRICFEGSSGGPFISPCKCAGTQKHIHVMCLRAWQENVQKLNVGDERAFRCSVCRSLFTLQPPKPKGSTRLLQALRGVGGALCITLLALGLSGPPWPHIALLVLLLLGTRSHSLLALALLLVATGLAVMHAKGLRIVMRMDGAGRLGLALVRRGPPVPGLGPGTLLVASEGLEHTMFRRSVVLIYEHGEEGSKGVMLTQALAQVPGSRRSSGMDMQLDSRHWIGDDAWPGGPNLAGLHGAIAIRHFFGGPMGMPGEGVHQEMVLLHSVRGVAGATEVPLAPPPPRPPPAPPSTGAFGPPPSPARAGSAYAYAGAGAGIGSGGVEIRMVARGGVGERMPMVVGGVDEDEEDERGLPFQQRPHKRAVAGIAEGAGEGAGGGGIPYKPEAEEGREGVGQGREGEGIRGTEGVQWREEGSIESLPGGDSSDSSDSMTSSATSGSNSGAGGSSSGGGGGGVSRRAMIERAPGSWQAAAGQPPLKRRQLCSSRGASSSWLGDESMVTQEQAQALEWARMQAGQGAGAAREGKREGLEGRYLGHAGEDGGCLSAGPGCGSGGGGGGDVAVTEVWPAAGAEKLFVGGTLAEVLERAAVQNPVASGGFQVVHVFHGLCAWGEAQLEGEIGSGAWSLAKATLGDIMPVPPSQLWETLKGSDRLVRPRH